MISERYLVILAEAAVLLWTAVSIKKKIPYNKIIIVAVFIFYMATLIGATFFPIKFDITQAKSRDDLSHRLQLIPFGTTMEFITTSSPYNTFVQIAGNIVMTIPFGFLLPFVHRFKRKFSYILSAVLLPLCIELTQLIIGILIGRLYRTADVDDLIYNFTGIMIGFALYKLLKKTINKRSKKTAAAAS